MYASLLTAFGKDCKISCDVCGKEYDHIWTISPRFIEEDEFLFRIYPDHENMCFCDTHFESLKKACELKGFKVEIIR